MSIPHGEPEPSSQVYTKTPARVIGACEYVLDEYVTHAQLQWNDDLLQVLRGSPAALYAEAAALEALAVLHENRGEILDLYFAELYASEQFEILTPIMPELVWFLRSRIAGQHPVLQMPAETLPVGLTFLLIAGHALRQAGENPAAMLESCIERMKHDPAEQRLPPGDLSYAPDGDGDLRDQLLRILSGTAPIIRAEAERDGEIWFAVDLAARPDVRDLMRMLTLDPPADGADVVTRWSVFAVEHIAVLRLQIDWLEPVRVRLALALDHAEHRLLMRAAARSTHVVIAAKDPADADPDEQILALRVPVDPASLKPLLAHATARRRGPGKR